MYELGEKSIGKERRQIVSGKADTHFRKYGEAYPLSHINQDIFFEDRPDIHIIAAGSLLEFLLAEHDFRKYKSRVYPDRLCKIFTRIPALIGKKLKYVNIDHKERSNYHPCSVKSSNS